MKSGKPITLSYLLAFTNLLIIKCSDASIYSRLNLISVNLKLIRAVLKPDMDKDEHLKTNLNNATARMKELRKSYSSALEVSYVYAAFNESFRAEFEEKIYDFLEDLYSYIEEYSLINEKTYGEVEAQSWNLPV
jgi:hypothetical protein